MSEEATLDEFGDVEEDDSDVIDREELIQGVAWSIIDSVPQEWEVNNVESDIEILAGNNFSSENFVDNGGIPLIRIRDLAEDDTTVNFDGEYDSRYLINQQDLLVGMDGEFEPHLWTGSEALLNQRVCRIESKSKYNKIFFRYAIEKPLFYIQKSIAGTTVKHLSQSNINDLNLPTPPLSEQRKIATVLYTVDQAIKKTEQIIGKREEIRRGLMQDIFRYGIDSAGELRSSGNDAYQETKYGLAPKGWEVLPLENIVAEGASITYGIVKPGDHYLGGVPVVKVKNITNGEVQTENLLHTDPEIHQKYDRAELKEGDLLFTIRGTVGRMAFVPESLEGGNLTQDTARIRIENANPEFVRYYLETATPNNYFERHTKGQAVQGINLEDLQQVPVHLPSRDEQERIVGILDSHTELIQKEREYRNQLQRLKRGLTQDLLSGTVRTTDTNIQVPEEIAQHG